MRLRDDLLRGAVYEAFDERDASGRVTREAAERVLHVHACAILIEYEQLLAAAADETERRLEAIEREPWRLHELLEPWELAA